MHDNILEDFDDDIEDEAAAATDGTVGPPVQPPAAEAETAGLGPGVPSLRPADVLTSAAFPGRLAALDIGITSPDSSLAGIDCCDSMHRRKLGVYRPYFARMEAKYQPLVWSKVCCHLPCY